MLERKPINYSSGTWLSAKTQKKNTSIKLGGKRWKRTSFVTPKGDKNY